MLCKAGGKEFKHLFENKTTKLLIYISESEVGIPTSQLIDIKKGNNSKFEQGSLIHPDLGSTVDITKFCFTSIKLA
jgi:hypothetical protein